MKVMISQSMNCRPIEQIKKERTKVEEALKNCEWEIVDTVFEEDVPKGCNGATYYLAKSIEVMSKVDAVMFMNGWHKARGCQIEHEICLKYNIPIMYEYEVI